MAKTEERDPRIDKRKVTMISVTATKVGDKIRTDTAQAVDYVRPDILDAYVANAQKFWQIVEVADEPDAGPAGYDGPTYVPHDLSHPLAGTYYPATDCKNCKHAPVDPRTGAKARVVRVEQES